MDQETNEKEKLEKLKSYLSNLKNLAVAFSGGVDSSFLLKVAKDVLGKNVKAYTIDTVYIPQREIEEAGKFTQKHEIKHEILTVPLINIIKHNPSDRCYFCKTFIFKKILNKAKSDSIDHVAEGTNFDDISHHRPGLKALKELGILSPLKELGFTKNDIRELSNDMKLPTWNKPAYACLLTRLPYGTNLSEKELRLIEDSENYLISIGFDGVRVRSHGNLARIEVLPEHMQKILNLDLLHNITNKLKNIGYQFVTIDTEGYKSGSFDHVK